MKASDINIRDLFILPYQGKYYMYGARVGQQMGFDGAYKFVFHVPNCSPMERPCIKDITLE